MRILIAEDDQVLADGLLRALRGAGAAVDHVASGTEADAALMTNTEFDLLILDLGLPKMHGLEVLKKLRGRGSSLPVLILTAADAVDERVKGLDYGADDYMAKPFSLQELEARVRALVRRGAGATSSTIKHGPLTYDQAGRVATIDGKMVELSACAVLVTTWAVFRTNPRRRQRWVNVRFRLKLQAEFRIGGNAPLSFSSIDTAHEDDPTLCIPEHWIAARPRRST